MNSDTGKRKKTAGKRKAINRRPINRKKADKKNFKKLIAALCAVLAVSVIIAAVLIYLLVIREQSADTPAEEIELPVITESEKESEIPENLGTDVVEHIITAGNAVDEAYKSRPESHKLTDENAADFAAVESCEIEAGTGKIAVTITGDGIPASDDKYYYLFALNTYDSGITAESEAIAKEYKDNTTKMTVALNYNRSNSRLYKKFVAAVKIDGKFVQVSAPEYITNPEVIAKYGSVYQQPSSKKGLLVDPNKLREMNWMTWE